MENESLMIPSGISDKQSIFDGFGRVELSRTIIIVFTGILPDYLFYSFTNNLSVCIISMLVLMVGSVMLQVKDSYMNLSVIDHCAHMIRFMNCQKANLYMFQREYEIEWKVVRK